MILAIYLDAHAVSNRRKQLRHSTLQARSRQESSQENTSQQYMQRLIFYSGDG